MESLVLLIALVVLLGAIFGWVSFFKLRTLQKQVTRLQHTLLNIVHKLENLGLSAREIAQLVRPTSTSAPEDRQREQQGGQQREQLAGEQQQTPDSPAHSISENVWSGESEYDSVELSPAITSASDAAPTTGLFSRLRDQWMIWLGGISIGLSGIFMVHYSIDQGLLGPLARVLLSVFGGLVLHAVAEWGRRRHQEQFQAFAALAGGASIILYTAFFAALNLYNLFPAGLVFVALILVSLSTMALAVLHGPVLAILGILAAYVVPALVDTGSDNVLSLYLYSLIITVAALLLMHYVYRPWLWSGMLAGSLGWWFLTIGSDSALELRGYYLAALLYLFLAIPGRDWLLRKPAHKHAIPESNGEDKEPPRRANSARARIIKSIKFPSHIGEAPNLLSIGLLVLAFGLTISVEHRVSSAVYQWTPFVVILLVAAGSKPELLKMVAASLVIQLLAWLSLGLTIYDGVQLKGLIAPGQFEFVIYAAWMAFVYSALSLRNLLSSPSRNFCCALAVASPLLWLSLCYLLVTDLSESIYWGAVAVALGLFYLVLAAWRLRLDKLAPLTEKNDTDREYFAVWLILAGHFAYSLAVAIMVREASLTLALAAQILSIAWLIHRYNPPRLDLFLKLLLAVVVIRLTLNPWLLTYPTDTHWSFWTYGGATIFAALAAWRLRDNEKLFKWLELASLHFLVLTLWAETRYYIYHGEVFRQQFDLLEFSINSALWLSLALVYYLRYRASQNLKPLYLLASKILLTLGIGSYLIVLFPLNPFWSGESVSPTPILNILLLSYGFPVLAGILLYRFYDKTMKKWLGMFVGASAFIFVNIEIRHLWSRDFSIYSITSSGELYTYTIVWLVIAIACLLAGSIRFGATIYRTGFTLMMLVIGKIFLLDTTDLEGLLRVASFAGLGLSLLGLTYLYQRFNLSPKKSNG